MIGMNSSPRQGFGLMEIMIVIAIMGFLASIVGPRLFSALSGAKIDTAKQSVRGVKSALDMFYLRHSDYPDSLKDLYSKPSNEEFAKDWREPYIDEQKLRDPWKQKFQYTKTPGQQHPYELYSYGPKGKSAAKNERINVWDL